MGMQGYVLLIEEGAMLFVEMKSVICSGFFMVLPHQTGDKTLPASARQSSSHPTNVLAWGCALVSRGGRGGGRGSAAGGLALALAGGRRGRRLELGRRLAELPGLARVRARAYKRVVACQPDSATHWQLACAGDQGSLHCLLYSQALHIRFMTTWQAYNTKSAWL